MNQKIDKDYLFKLVVRMIGEDMHFDSAQMTRVMNIITTVFSDVDFVATENMLSTDRCNNEVIIKNFIGCKRMGGVKDSSLKQYNWTILAFLRFCSNKDLTNITTDDIRRYLLYYEKSVCKKTANNCRINLNVFFQFMEDEEYIAKNPVRKIPKIKEDIKYKRFYTDLEIESMRDACTDKRELAIVDLLISTGLRVTEVSNILLSEINWEQRTIVVHGKGSKDRVVPFSVRCKKHLQEYLLQRGINISSYLFCSQRKPYYKLSKDSINKIIKNIGARVELPDITVHCFRRWLASDLNKKGVDPTIIQQILGHTTFETTQKHYLSKSYDKISYIHNIYAG